MLRRSIEVRGRENPPSRLRLSWSQRELFPSDGLQEVRPWRRTLESAVLLKSYRSMKLRWGRDSAMCGRMTLHKDQLTLLKAFGLKEKKVDFRPSYNIAPTQPVAAVLNREGEKTLEALRWGLVPSWVDDPAIGNRLINARSETAAEKPVGGRRAGPLHEVTESERSRSETASSLPQHGIGRWERSAGSGRHALVERAEVRAEEILPQPLGSRFWKNLHWSMGGETGTLLEAQGRTYGPAAEAAERLLRRGARAAGAASSPLSERFAQKAGSGGI